MFFKKSSVLSDAFEKFANRAIKDMQPSQYNSEKEFLEMFKLSVTIFINRNVEERSNALKIKGNISDRVLNKRIKNLKRSLLKMLDRKVNEMKKIRVYYTIIENK